MLTKHETNMFKVWISKKTCVKCDNCIDFHFLYLICTKIEYNQNKSEFIKKKGYGFWLNGMKSGWNATSKILNI
jgi:hypothetical protein